MIRRAGGALVVLFGLSVAGRLRIPSLMREWRIELQDRPAGYLGALVIGITFAAGRIPCVGPMLLGRFDEHNWTLSGAYADHQPV